MKLCIKEVFLIFIWFIGKYKLFLVFCIEIFKFLGCLVYNKLIYYLINLEFGELIIGIF